MQGTSRFSSKEAFRFGWNTFKNNPGFFITLFAGIMIISFGFKALEDAANRPGMLYGALSIVLQILDALFRVMVTMGLIEISIAFFHGHKAELGDLFHTKLKTLFNYFLVSTLSGLIVLGGLLLLIVPGIVWGLRFQFASYFILDKDMGPIQALKASWAATKGEVWDLFKLAIIVGLVNLLGLLALGVGIFVSAPVSLLAMAFVYRKLADLPQTAPVAEVTQA